MANITMIDVNIADITRAIPESWSYNKSFYRGKTIRIMYKDINLNHYFIKSVQIMDVKKCPYAIRNKIIL